MADKKPMEKDKCDERIVQLSKAIKVKTKLGDGIVSYLNDIQQDYAAVMKFLIERSGWGHLAFHDTHCDITTPDQSSALSASTHADMPRLLELLAKGGKPAENCYGLFYEHYKPATKLKSNNIISVLASSLDHLGDDEFDKKVATASRHKHLISREEWVAYRRRVRRGESHAEVRSEIEKKAGNPNIGVAATRDIRRDMVFPKPIRPQDYNYCYALMYMVVSSFSSWAKTAALHQDSRKALAETIAAAKQPQLFALVSDLSDELERTGYGLSAKVFFESIKILAAGKPQGDYAPSCGEMSKPKYRPLLAAGKRELDSAYDTWKVSRKLARMKPYTSMPRLDSNYLVPFGLTGRGHKFGMSVEKNHIVLDVMGQEIELFTNNYFDNPAVEVRDNGYSLKFRHTVKFRGKKKGVVKGDWRVGKVNEVKFRKVEGGYEVHIPYKVEHPKGNFFLQRFFNAADPDKTEKYLALIPDEVVLAGFDLNLSTPLTMSVGRFSKGSSQGELVPFLYGNGSLIREPQAVAKDTSKSARISSLSNKARDLVKSIRAHRRLAAARGQIPPEELEGLEGKFFEEHQRGIDEQLEGVRCGNFRHKVQTLTGLYNRSWRALKKECRDGGHKVLSESVRLLQLGDVMNSLNNSYSRFNPGTQKTFFKNRRKRENFRDFVSKQYGAQIAAHSLSVNANAVFIEDIEIDLDSDKSSGSNSISMLFAAGQLKKCIAIALNKVGIGCVFVNPAMTSQFDASTGLFGFRNTRLDKGNLYVRRGDTIGKIDADVVASLNVLLVGINHSICPRRIFVKNCRIINGHDEAVPVNPDQGRKKDGSKRMDRFLKHRSLTHLSLDRAGKLVPGNVGLHYTGYAYFHSSGYLTDEQRKRWKDDIESDVKDLRRNNVKIENLILTCPPGSTYNAFRVG